MPVRSRRQAREAALRALYQIEVGKVGIEEAVSELKENANLAGDLARFAEEEARGVFERRARLEASISECLTDWTFDRLAIVDRILLLIGAYELYHCEDIPPKVTLNEAIELAKKYSTAESGKFVNGVLARVAESSPKAGFAAEEANLEPLVEPEPESPLEEVLSEGSEEHAELENAGNWVIREGPKS